MAQIWSFAYRALSDGLQQGRTASPASVQLDRRVLNFATRRTLRMRQAMAERVASLQQSVDVNVKEFRGMGTAIPGHRVAILGSK